MQPKNLQSLLSKVSSQPAAFREAELLPQELAAQLKSGTALQAEGPLMTEPTGLWRLISPWLPRRERAASQPGRAGHFGPGPPAGGA